MKKEFGEDCNLAGDTNQQALQHNNGSVNFDKDTPMNSSHYDIVFFKENLPSRLFVEKIADNLANGIVSPSVDDYFLAPHPTLVLNVKDLTNGSFQYNNLQTQSKIFFYKTLPLEIENTTLLKQLGLKELVEYEGSVAVHDLRYHFTTLPGASINMSRVKWSDKAPTEYFGSFDLLTLAAELLAKIHKAGFMHNNFLLENMILPSDKSFPKILLYANAALKPVTNPADQDQEVIQFLESISLLNPGVDLAAYQKHFLDRYSQT
jgi:hypothetical protein